MIKAGYRPMAIAWLLSLGLLLFAGPAGALKPPVKPDWRLVGTNATNVYYIDAASIRKGGETVAYDVMTVHDSFAPLLGRQPLYMVVRWEARCDSRRQRAPETRLFDTEGLEVFVSAHPNAPWFIVTPNTDGATQVDFACLGKLPVNQSATRGKTALQLATADAARLAAASAAWLATERARTGPAAKN